MTAEASIGPYTILRLINQGGQGQVYLGYDRRLRRQVAIKIHRLPSARRARRHALDEARKIAAIQSPRVVQIYDVMDSGDYLVMVMEYVPGCDLAEYLSTVQPSVASVITVGADLAAALAAARQQGVVHGDLKAANVLITTAGRVKLTDFGIAREPGDGQKEQGASVTALSPEQALGLGLDMRADLFALGRLLYAMLAGQQPFRGSPDIAVRALLEREAVPLQAILQDAEAVPPQLLSLIQKLLDKDPAGRPANTHQVRHALRQAARQLPLSTAGSLLREARPCFRPESAADIPPPIPSQLRQRGRFTSALRGQWLASVGRLLSRYPGRVAVWLLILLGFLAPLASLIDRAGPEVYIEQTRYEVNPAARLPSEISRSFLAELVRDEVQQRVARARVRGVSGPRVYHAGLVSEDRPGGDRLIPGLRCSELFCVFVLQRQSAEGSGSRQVVLFPEQPVEQWRQSVRETVAGLYD